MYNEPAKKFKMKTKQKQAKRIYNIAITVSNCYLFSFFFYYDKKK